MRYYKKPLEVQVWHVGHEDPPDCIKDDQRIYRFYNGEIVVMNKYGSIKAYRGDYVVKDAHQFYVFHEGEFDQAYEKVN